MINKNKKGDELLKEIEQSTINNCKPVTLEEFNKFMEKFFEDSKKSKKEIQIWTNSKEVVNKFDQIMKEELKSLSLKPYIPAPLENGK